MQGKMDTDLWTDWCLDRCVTEMQRDRQTGGRGTCRLPRGQYSVMMQVFGGSMQAPMNRVRCSFWTSLIYTCKQRHGVNTAGIYPQTLTSELHAFTLTCLSWKRTFLFSSMRFLLVYLMATMFPCNIITTTWKIKTLNEFKTTTQICLINLLCSFAHDLATTSHKNSLRTLSYDPSTQTFLHRHEVSSQSEPVGLTPRNQWGQGSEVQTIQQTQINWLPLFRNKEELVLDLWKVLTLLVYGFRTENGKTKALSW